MQHKNNKKRGFTIIETMIAISIFLIIIVIGMGALLNANLLHQKSRDMRSILDNLSFIMEDMSNNLRTGFEYQCLDPLSDGSCSGIKFKPQDYATDNNYWVYYVGAESGKIGIFKSNKDGDNGTWIQLTPDEVIMDLDESYFEVAGALKTDKKQPFVTIRLVGHIEFKKGIKTPFSLQTSVSQRLIDI